MAKKKSGWKNGSFKAALGGYIKKVGKQTAKSLWASFKKDTLGIKKRKKK